MSIKQMNMNKRLISKAFKIEPEMVVKIQNEAREKDLTFSAMVREMIQCYFN